MRGWTAAREYVRNVSMASRLPDTAPRRVPRQQRGRRRVERLLQAAEREIARAGYDAATMSAIAHRAGSCVGSLYQFFPNKEALVEALRASYLEEHAKFWNGLQRRLPAMSVEQLVNQLLDFPIAFVGKHPAFLPLLDLPPTAHSLRRRTVIRDRIADALRTARPQHGPAGLARTAAVVQQVVRSCLTLYGQAEGENQKTIVGEFRTMLSGYLRARLGEPGAERRLSGRRSRGKQPLGA